MNFVITNNNITNTLNRIKYEKEFLLKFLCKFKIIIKANVINVNYNATTISNKEIHNNNNIFSLDS